MASLAIEESKISAVPSAKSAELDVDGLYIEPKLSQNLIKKRQALLAKLDLRDYQIPNQFPNHVPSASDLSAEHLDVARVTYELRQADIEELEVALSTFQSMYYLLISRYQFNTIDRSQVNITSSMSSRVKPSHCRLWVLACASSLPISTMDTAYL